MMDFSVFSSVLILCLVQEGFTTFLQDYSVIHQIVDTKFVSVRCAEDLNLFSERLSDGELWAMKMLDASSKVPVGPISYNYADIGRFQECTEIKSEQDNIRGKYCMGNVVFNASRVDLHSSKIYKKGKIQIFGTPTWSMCLPDSCSSEDAMNLMTKLQPSGFGIGSVSCQTIEDVHPPLTRDAVVGISILSFLLLLVISSTIYDINNKEAHPSLIAFSIYTNGKNVFQLPQRPSILDCLDGIRVLSMLWIIILHTYSVYTSGSVFSAEDVNRFNNSLYSMFFINGDLACDAFLIVGGTLVTYVYFRKQKDENMTVSDIAKHYFHRFIRLTPPLAGVVLVSATLLRYFGSGPRWPIIVNIFEGFCKQNWWSTLLYVQNEVNVNQMCVGHAWYLNIDMQLYIFSPIIFWMLRKHSKPGIAILLLATLSSITVAFFRAFEDELTGIKSNIYSKNKELYMNEYYLKTETRAAPWLMGTMLGYIITKKTGSTNRVHLPKKFSIPMWIICFAVILLCVFGGFGTLRGPEYHRLQNAFYIAFVRPAFSLTVGWIIWACATKNGGIINAILSSVIFKFMNKFIYSMYLTHVTSLYMIVFASKTPSVINVFNLVYWFWGVFGIMFGVSIIWVLVFETPMMVLERIILPPTTAHSEKFNSEREDLK